MNIELKIVDLRSPKERAELVQFVNRNYSSEIPLTDESVAEEKIVFFWAVAPKGKGKPSKAERVGVTGYMPKTHFLAETVKTVIAAQYRGKGLGTILSQAIEDEVRSRGYKKVITTIYITNLPMIIIKLKQGYRFEGFHPDHDKPGLHEYSMGKVFSRTPGT